MRDDLNARAPAAHRRARPGEARHRQLSRRDERGTVLRARTIRSSRSSAGARSRSRASCGSSATTISETSAEGLFPPRARAPRCACATATSSSASAPTRTPTATSSPCTARTIRQTRSGTPGRRRAQGEGQHPLAVGGARGAGGSAPLRPPVRGAVSRARAIRTARRRRERGAKPGGRRAATVVAGRRRRCRRRRVERNYLDDLNPESKRVIRAFVEPALAGAAPEDALPVRAARLLRRRPRRPRAGQAGVQPHGDAADSWTQAAAG